MFSRMGRKGQFFSIDVFVAIAIIGIGLFVLYSTKTVQPSDSQTISLSSDLMKNFNSHKVKDIDNAFIITLIQNGTIQNSDNTLLQQISEFYVYGQNDTASNLTQSVTEGILPFQYAFALYVNGSLVYQSRAQDPQTPNLIVTKRIVYGVKNSTAFWGPFLAEVRVWR